MRKTTRTFLQLVTRIYIEKVVVKGRRNIPLGSTFIMAGNHPSGLLDALVLMSAFPRVQMSGVAKEGLFAVRILYFQHEDVSARHPFNSRLPRPRPDPSCGRISEDYEGCAGC